MPGDSSAVADVSPTVGVLQSTLLRETLLELNETRTEMDIYRYRLEKLEADREAEHQRSKQLEARLEHHINEEKHLAAELRVRDDEVIERQQTIEELRAERLSPGITCSVSSKIKPDEYNPIFQYTNNSNNKRGLHK